jgi:hypothetical protein
MFLPPLPSATTISISWCTSLVPHRVADLRAVLHDRVRGLHEEERRLAIRVVPHFLGVLGVVAADAVDASHREAHVAAFHRDGGDRTDVDHVLGVAKVVFAHTASFLY